MDGDGSGFAFSATADFNKAQDNTDPMSSWADMFLDSIHSDEPASTDANNATISDSGLGPPLENATSQSSTNGPLLRLTQQSEKQQIISDTLTDIPTHLQASVPNNNSSIVQLPQSNTSSSIASVAYLNPAAVSQQQRFKSVGNIQNVLSTTQQLQQQQQQQASQGNTKLVQIAPSIPVATVQQLQNNVPLQTLLQPGQALAGQTIYSNQNQGLFPQGSVHIENPKVVNVNFGPHVIQQDSSGQQAFIQTAEGKRVLNLITNPLQGLPQSISLTQPIMGAHLINAGGSVNHVIRTTMAQTGPTLVPSSNSNPRQIVLPAGQAVIPRQSGAQQAAGFSKNVVLRQINPSVQSVIYQGGQNNVAGQLIQSPQTLIASSGTGLQVVSAGAGNQGNQVQLIAQPSINQTAMGQQQINQNALMNLINNQGMLQPNAGNQLSGLMSGQNILVNGQMININQLGGLAAIPQLQVQANNNADTTTVAGINAATANRTTGQFPANSQVFIPQHQQQLLMQPKTNTPSPSLLSSSDGSQKLNFQGKTIGTPLHNANSASSTPALTPTPSTPTPTCTPDNVLDDLCGPGTKTNHNNILEQALKMSSIDFDSIEDEDLTFLTDTDGSSNHNNTITPVVATPPPPPQHTQSPALFPKTKPQPIPKSKAKAPKSKQNKQMQPIVNVTVNNNLNRNTNNFNSTSMQAVAQSNAQQQSQKVSLSPQQKLITPSGQVYVLSADGQQLVLQQQASNPLMGTTINAKASATQSSISQSSPSTANISRPNINIPATGVAQVRHKSPGDLINNRVKSQIAASHVKVESSTTNQQTTGPVQKTFSLSTNQSGSHVFVKTGMGSLKSSVVPVSSSQSLPQISPALSSQAHFVQVKNQQISTLAGKFFKQEPVAVVKQEPVDRPADNKPPFSFFDPPQTTANSNSSGSSSSSISSSANITSSSQVTSTLVVGMNTSHSCITTTPPICAPTIVTSTSHDMSIMSIASSPAVSSVVPSASSCSPSVRATASSSAEVAPTPPSIPLQSPAPSQGSGKNTKWKEPSNIKTLTQIKIANSTLTLSLTPFEKERFEKEVSSMSMEKQVELLSHQQHIIRWSQEKQMKQKQQQSTVSVSSGSLVPETSVSSSGSFVGGVCSASAGGSHTVSPAVVATSGKGRKSSTVVTQINSSMLPTIIQEFEEKPAASSENQQQSSEKLWQPQQQRPPVSMPQEVPSLKTAPSSSSSSSSSTCSTPIPTPTHQAQSSYTSYSSVGRCLAEQQLSRDRCLALGPDTNTPFKSFSDAMRRLVRFHTLQDHKPEEESREIKEWDDKYSKLCEQLVQRKRRFMRRFTKLMVYQDMCQENRPESLQNLMHFNENLKETLERQREEAINHPESFQRYLSESQRRRSFHEDDTSDRDPSSSEEDEPESEEESEEEDDDGERSECEPTRGQSYHTEISTTIKQEPKNSPVYSSSLKRKHTETASSGTLKLVFKRRNTDQSFTIKNSTVDNLDVSEDMKPVVNMEKSDSLYEFDANSNGVGKDSCVVVRRRGSSVSFVSRQASFENCSVSMESSLMSSSYNDDEKDDEGELEEMGEDENRRLQSGNLDYSMSDEEEEEEEGPSDSVNENNAPSVDGSRLIDDGYKYSQYSNRRHKVDDAYSNSYHSSHLYNSSSGYLTNPEDGKVDISVNNQFLNHELSSDWVGNPNLKNFVGAGNSNNRPAVMDCDIKPRIRYSDISAADTHSGISSFSSKKSDTATGEQLLRMQHMSTASDDVFIPSSQDYSQEAGNAGDFHPEQYRSPKPTSRHSSSMERSRNGSSAASERNLRLSSSQSADNLDNKFVPDTPTPSISQLGSDCASDLFPSNVLFHTPNKSLLQTDAMFNTSSEDEDLENNSTSTFKIDNRDPQSSMVNDSVQTAINSVINNDDDDDIDNSHVRTNAQHRWVPSSRPSQTFFQSSLSTSSVHHDEDLDAAVQSILNPPTS